MLPQDQDPVCLSSCLAREPLDRCPVHTAMLPQDQDPGHLSLCFAREKAGQMSGHTVWRPKVPFVRCLVFLPPSLARHYEALARRAGVSRSRLVRYALERGLPDAEEYVRSGRAAADQVADSTRVREARERTSSSPRPAAATAVQDRAHLVASVEQLAYRQLQETPSLDPAAVKRLVALNVETLLGGPPDSDVLDEAVERVLSARPNDPPKPVGGNRPPE